jgi:hypothetical protein
MYEILGMDKATANAIAIFRCDAKSRDSTHASRFLGTAQNTLFSAFISLRSGF